MSKKSFMLLMLASFVSVCLFANDSIAVSNTKGDSSIDWFQIIVMGGYIVGVFVLLPIIIYTNLKEGLTPIGSAVSVKEGLSEDERNNLSKDILEKIELKLTPFKSDSGEELVTITKGSQARFMRRGLDYINKNLNPTDKILIDRINEFSEVYKDRAKRVFTGSWWIIICSAALAVLFFMTAGISTFLFIHILGLAFYVLSSRTTVYGIEKRLNVFKYIPAFISGIMTALFIGDGVKYYVKSGSGPWKRDWESEGDMAIMGLVLLAIVAMVLGFLAAVLGVVNFVSNYSTSFILPFTTDEKWYAENIG